MYGSCNLWSLLVCVCQEFFCVCAGYILECVCVCLSHHVAGYSKTLCHTLPHVLLDGSEGLSADVLHQVFGVGQTRHISQPKTQSKT